MAAFPSLTQVPQLCGAPAVEQFEPQDYTFGALMFYRLIFSLLLVRFPAEGVHHFAFACLRFVMAIPGVKALSRWLLLPKDDALRVEAFGLSFPSPVMLAAGFDKDARGIDALAALGFGAIEIGTVTAHAQPGNPKPRMFRLPKDRALINRLGFNNGGADLVRTRVGKPRDVVLGINIGKTKATPDEHAIEDYVASTEKLAPFADYLVVNVSSPNTPGLRALQSVEKLRPLLIAVREATQRVAPQRRVPLLVKIAPDLADDDIDAVADLANELALDGVIANNTTLSRDGLCTPAAEVLQIGAGGLSGAPLKARSLQVLRRLRMRLSDRVTLIAVGGIENGDDAWERIRAGATLVQIYTGFIYGGPFTASRIARRIAARMKTSSVSRLSEAVGAERV